MDHPETSTVVSVRCCIVGGGPAGMMLGFLLARAGVEVAVLEKHKDFLRDFRGDTIHPATLELMHELGLLDAFLAQPHQELPLLAAQIGDTTVPFADFSRLQTVCKFIALMPQWNFLDFLAREAQRYPAFKLLMETAATGVVVEAGRIRGVRATTPNGALEVRAALVVAADGRHSTIREHAGLRAVNLGAPIDVLWLRLSRRNGDPAQTLGRFNAGRFFITLDRGAYWQCAYVIPKDGYERVRVQGLHAFRDDLAMVAPFLADRVGELRSWDDVKLLTVTVARLRRWYRPRLLCIGDAAHAMSPVGGVGINLAIADAVASANILFAALRSGEAPVRLLRDVQRRRALPAALTQRIQMLIQERILRPALREVGAPTSPATLPLPIRAFARFPALQAIPARFIGLGFRPEHVRSPDVVSALLASASNEGGRDVAGVLAPPPLLFAGALVASLYVERRVAHAALPALSRVLGAALGIVALSIGPAAVRTMRAARTHVNPYQPSSAIVATGPFAFTRNPIYLSMTLLYAGISLGARATFPLGVLPAVLWLMNAGVIEREERYLAEKFPQDYPAYAARVPRWL